MWAGDAPMGVPTPSSGRLLRLPSTCSCGGDVAWRSPSDAAERVSGVPLPVSCREPAASVQAARNLAVAEAMNSLSERASAPSSSTTAAGVIVKTASANGISASNRPSTSALTTGRGSVVGAAPPGEAAGRPRSTAANTGDDDATPQKNNSGSSTAAAAAAAAAAASAEEGMGRGNRRSSLPSVPSLRSPAAEQRQGRLSRQGSAGPAAGGAPFSQRRPAAEQSSAPIAGRGAQQLRGILLHGDAEMLAHAKRLKVRVRPARKTGAACQPACVRAHAQQHKTQQSCCSPSAGSLLQCCSSSLAC